TPPSCNSSPPRVRDLLDRRPRQEHGAPALGRRAAVAAGHGPADAPWSDVRRSAAAPGNGSRARRRLSQVPLVPLVAQPDGVPWPTDEWPVGELPGGAAFDVERLLDRVCDDDGPLATTYAVLLIHRGRLVAERYQGQLEHFDRAADPVTVETPLLSWSMAKSML